MTDHSFRTALDNVQIIDQHRHLLVADDQGNLSYVSSYNLLGRLIRWIKRWMMPDEVKRVYEVVFDTFETLNHNMALIRYPEDRVWTYKQTVDGKEFDRGFDHIAIELLADPYFLQFNNSKAPEVVDLSRQISDQLYSTLSFAMHARGELEMAPWENQIPEDE